MKNQDRDNLDVRETPVGAVEIFNSWIRIRQKHTKYFAQFSIAQF